MARIDDRINRRTALVQLTASTVFAAGAAKDDVVSGDGIARLPLDLVDHRFELRDVNIVFPERQLTVVTGPTASGKISSKSPVDGPQSNSEKNRVGLRAHFGSQEQPRGFVCDGPREALKNFIHLRNSASARGAVPGASCQERGWPETQGTATAA